MANNQEAPKIEGSNDIEKETDQKEQKELLVEQAIQMDLPDVPPNDETPFSRDVEAPPQEDKVELAKEAAKKTVSEAQRASLEKARAARAEKRKREKATGQDLNQGGPAPDLLQTFVQAMNSKFETVLEQLADLRKIQATQGPLQDQHNVLPTPSKQVPLPAGSNDYMLTQTVDQPEEFPTRGGIRPRSPSPQERHVRSRMLDEAESYNSRFRKALETNQFVNQASRQRVATNPTEMGSTYTGMHHGNGAQYMYF